MKSLWQGNADPIPSNLLLLCELSMTAHAIEMRPISYLPLLLLYKDEIVEVFHTFLKRS